MSSTSMSGELHCTVTWLSLEVTDAATSIRAEGSTNPPDHDSRISTRGERAVVEAALGMAVGAADDAGDGANEGIRKVIVGAGSSAFVDDGIGMEVGAGIGASVGAGLGT